ncbi:MAG TPA: sigma-70 family RNA polymerase sigma factor, partial [Acidimicrobiales bacterium]|nr:sigma-70 family RNA polymerase sigma factor [Acidimicrobiales bacterium]
LGREAWGYWVALRADDVDLDRDAALVERFQTGDEEAFADLYQRYFGRLRRYCERRLGDHHDAEEAAQEALIKAYRALPTFGGDRRFYPWLRVIAANVCTDRCKRKPVAAPADPDRGDVVVDSVFDNLDRAFVRAALRDLNPRHQTALSLWADGHPSRHIAEELGCTPGAADVTLHRARQSFRTRFLALAGDGKMAAVGLVPALGRWAQRWRARVVTRVGDHAELATPLATKLAAGAIAFTVVGGAVAAGAGAGTAPHPTAPPPSVAHVQTAPVSTIATPAPPAPAPQTTPTPAVANRAAPTPPPTPAASPPPASPDLTPSLMSADQARAKGQDAPVRIEVPGVVGLALDPTNLNTVFRPKESS